MSLLSFILIAVLWFIGGTFLLVLAIRAYATKVRPRIGPIKKREDSMGSQKYDIRNE